MSKHKRMYSIYQTLEVFCGLPPFLLINRNFLYSIGLANSDRSQKNFMEGFILNDCGVAPSEHGIIIVCCH